MQTMANTASNRGRIKLAALLLFLSLPMLLATLMAVWRVGIPEGRTAHGELVPTLPVLAAWPLVGAHDEIPRGRWVLAFDCTVSCAEPRDQWWRLHRALGREAPRVMRLRIGGPAQPLPGEVVANWRPRPAWGEAGRLWFLDPLGTVVLAYEHDAEPQGVLDDIRRLLKINQPP